LQLCFRSEQPAGSVANIYYEAGRPSFGQWRVVTPRKPHNKQPKNLISAVSASESRFKRHRAATIRVVSSEGAAAARRANERKMSDGGLRMWEHLNCGMFPTSEIRNPTSEIPFLFVIQTQEDFDVAPGKAGKFRDILSRLKPASVTHEICDEVPTISERIHDVFEVTRMV
jgi:hypothetical protein